MSYKTIQNICKIALEQRVKIKYKIYQAIFLTHRINDKNNNTYLKSTVTKVKAAILTIIMNNV